MKYNYKARKPSGQIFQGIVEAADENTAADILIDRGIAIISIEEVSRVEYDSEKGFTFTFLKGKIKRKEVLIFARQLAVMISANVPVVQSLRIIVQQTESEHFKEIISDIADEVENGVKLSGSLAKYPKVFSEFFASMIKSGETSGKLDEVLEYLADQEEKDYDLTSKIKGAMIYPIFIMSGLVVVGVAMMIFVIPQLTSMLTASGSELPFTTKVLIGSSHVMRQYWWALIIVIAGIIFGTKWLLSTTRGRSIWDAFKLKIPIFGNLFKMIYLVRFTRSLSTLVVGGVPLARALEIVSEVVGNMAYRELIEETIKEVEDGNSVAVVFLRSDIVPKLVSNMLAVGEKTGRLDNILNKVSDFYSREIENMVANMTHLIEPFIMVLIGVAVGGMVASIILPMYNLANQF